MVEPSQASTFLYCCARINFRLYRQNWRVLSFHQQFVQFVALHFCLPTAMSYALSRRRQKSVPMTSSSEKRPSIIAAL
jgi:hypothetical protein